MFSTPSHIVHDLLLTVLLARGKKVHLQPLPSAFVWLVVCVVVPVPFHVVISRMGSLFIGCYNTTSTFCSVVAGSIENPYLSRRPRSPSGSPPRRVTLWPPEPPGPPPNRRRRGIRAGTSRFWELSACEDSAEECCPYRGHWFDIVAGGASRAAFQALECFGYSFEFNFGSSS